MKIAAMWLLLFWAFHLPAAGQQNYWQQQADFEISVKLNDKDHELDGFERIHYQNNSPDTLQFIWMHLWMNAYKNDRTAFSDQLLAANNTSFYFSDNAKRGYVNRLNFEVNGVVAVMEDHPQHQDIIKLKLPSPLAPGTSCDIETAFHIKLPYNFSRGGHVGQSYQVTQWYPKPAVYDRKGWHAMPYLEDGEFYSDFGNYLVNITLPESYVVAATGEMEDSNVGNPAPSSPGWKTLTFRQDDVIDFAWFADKRYVVSADTVTLLSGRKVKLSAYSLPSASTDESWRDAVKYIRSTITERSIRIGEYPYNTATVVQANTDYHGGMEYPTITLVSGMRTKTDVQKVIEHEVGHNWFYGILASNERDHAWMDEGINSYYDHRAFETVQDEPAVGFFRKRIPKDPADLAFRTQVTLQKDQPINLPSDQYSNLNYGLSVYHKAGKWMKALEQKLGKPLLDSAMRNYFAEWKFKHPYPEDLQSSLTKTTGLDLAPDFALLHSRGALPQQKPRPVTRFTTFFNFKETDKHNYIAIAPAVGFNLYDKFMIGVALHNYSLPPKKFQFLLVPLYATGSKQVNGLAALNFNWFPAGDLERVNLGINASRFSSNHSLDTAGSKIFENFYRLVPHLSFHFRHSPSSQLRTWIDLRSFIINERSFDDYGYIAGSDSNLSYPRAFSQEIRYVNQASFNAVNDRALYPYSYQLQLQQGEGFYRVNAAAAYFFNYAKGGGLQLRLFAAKFGFLGDRNNSAYRYQPKLLAANGVDDYTYSDYFIGRTASTAFGEIPVKNGGLAAQQVTSRNTGGLHLRLDPYSSVQGYSEDWIGAINVNSSLPEKLFPIRIPLKVFFDAGTYSEAWRKNAITPKFLYVGGLQLSLFHDVLNIYAPLFYSKVFSDQLKTDEDANKFTRKITFSIDLQQVPRALKKKFPILTF